MFSITVGCTLDDAKVADTANRPGFAVVELFTSEGCSSCPPADAVVHRLVADARESGKAVYPLAFHVDYWNSLGWSDRFSSAEASNRQKYYAAALGLDQIYTPQMIVNGSTEFLGSDARKANAAIGSAFQHQPDATISTSFLLHPHTIEVHYTTSGSTGKSVLIALVERGLTTQVAAGENGGRTLAHDNVVRAFQTEPIPANDNGLINLIIPADETLANSSIIAFVQDPTTKTITAATQIDVHD